MSENKQEFEPRIGQVLSESHPGVQHQVSWSEWGDPENTRLLFCAHGLSRNGRDFDYLAQSLLQEYRIICPDYPGRGKSEWLQNKSYYHNQQYVQDTLAILDSVDYETLHWVGTSMGGLIGMALASTPENPISKMVINDVGPFIPGSALATIGEYLEEHPVFSDHEQAMEYFRTVYSTFGKLDEEHYEHFVRHSVCPDQGGNNLILNYDPAIIDQFLSVEPGDIEIWDVWSKIKIPSLILRGKHSTLLLAQTVEQMKHFHGNADSKEFDDCAHAPSLMENHQIEFVTNWLTSA